MAKEKLDVHCQTITQRYGPLPGMKPKNWRQTKQHGVNVWSSASIWMREGVMFSFEFAPVKRRSSLK